MSKRPRSEIWDHVEKTSADSIKCKLCLKEFSYSGSTSTLSCHIQTAHANVSASTASSVKTTMATTQPKLVFGVKKFTDARQEKVICLLTKFVISNMLPLPLVDDAAFIEFVHFLEPEYKTHVVKRSLNILTA